MKILIIDDSRVMRMTIHRTLLRAGFEDHEFAFAEDGASAHLKVGEWGPDLVLADWVMPGMSGLELLQVLREEDNHVPFCFITSQVQEHFEETAMESGATRFIQKPITAESLQKALAGLIA